LLRETRTIPIVFVGVADPVFSGFATSLARPAGNVTGFAVAESSIGGKWIEFLKEIAPDVTRAAIVFNPQMAVGGGSYYMHAIEEASRSLAIMPIAAPVLNADDIEGAIAGSTRERGGGLVVPPDAFTVLHAERIIALAAQYRLPAVYGWPFLVREGGLISYSVDIVDQYRKAASYVDRILKGEKPANLPVQTPTKFDLAVNVKTAKALGLTVPPSMQQLADEVIE
jgi:putative ABC transport system substrate-binding protein